MEAHGHEEIEKNVAAFFKQVVKAKYPDIYKVLYSVLRTTEDGQFDDVENAMYLGNWLTDLSQLFAPDTIFDFKATAGEKMEKYNHTIDLFFGALDNELNALDSKIREIVYTGIKYYGEGKEFVKETIDDIRILSTQELHVLEFEANKVLNSLLVGENKNIKLGKIIDEFKDFYKSSKKSVKDKSTDEWKQKVKELHNFEDATRNFTEDTLDELSNLKINVLDFFDVLSKNIKFPDNLIKELMPKDGTNHSKFKYYDNRNEFWELAFAIIKMMAYKKFVKERGMPLEDYRAIINSFIETDTPPKDNANVNDEVDRFHFKLNQYYPSDHLDRAFSSDKLQYFTKKKYNKRSYFIDETISESSETHRYKYLDDYINVITSKLTQLNADFFIPTFYDKNALQGVYKSKLEDSRNSTLINIARLGQTLHAVEDFFAHSNFLELSTFLLDSLKHPTLPQSNFFSNEEYLKYLSPDEITRYKHALLKANQLSDNHIEFPPHPEINISTGFFADGDMYTSLYHVLFGWMEEKLHSEETEEKISDKINKKVEKIGPYAEFFFPEAFKGVERYTEYDKIEAAPFILFEYINLLNNEKGILKILGKLTKNEEKPDYFTDVAFDYIFENSVTLKTKKQWKPIKFDDEDIAQLKEIINQIINVYYNLKKIKGEVKTLKDIWKSLPLVKELLMMVVCLLGVALGGPLSELFAAALMSRFKKLVREMVGEKIYKLLEDTLTKIIIFTFEKLLHFLGNLIETHALHRWDAEKQGSHSVLAKDEAYKNIQMNYLAKRGATLTDKAIVLALLTANKTDDKGKITELLNIQDLVNKFLSHPFSNTQVGNFNTSNSGNSNSFPTSFPNNNLPLYYMEQIAFDEAYANTTLNAIFTYYFAHMPLANYEEAISLFLVYNPYIKRSDLQAGSQTTVATLYKRMKDDSMKPTTLKSNNGTVDFMGLNAINNRLQSMVSDPYSISGALPMYRIMVPVHIHKKLLRITNGWQLICVNDFYTGLKNGVKVPHWSIILYEKDTYKLAPYQSFNDKLNQKTVQALPYLLMPIMPVSLLLAPAPTTNNEPPAEPSDTLKKFYEFYNLGEPNINHYAPDSIISQIAEGMATEVTVKANFEQFLEEYYKLYYEPAKDDKKKK